MSNFLLEAGRQTLMLELQEASRLPERLGDDFIRAAETIIHCEGKPIVSGIGKSGHIGKKLAATLASTGTPALNTYSGARGLPASVTDSGPPDRMIPFGLNSRICSSVTSHAHSSQ